MGWFGRMQRRDRGYVRHIMLRVELSGRRKRGRPQRRFMDVVKEGMWRVGATERDTRERAR